MFIQVFPSGPFSTNSYVVACSHSREAAIIDPAPDSASAIEAFLTQQNFNPQKILLTHSHWDHIADVNHLKEKYALPVLIHSLDVPNLQHPGTDGLPCWIHIIGVEPDILLQEGEQIKVGELSFQVLHTPGHSPGCICFFEPQQHVLFSGDTLFKGTIGNLSFPTSQPTLMSSSLAKLAQLPPQTRVFPGHGPSTTIQAESEWLCDPKKLFDL